MHLLNWVHGLITALKSSRQTVHVMMISTVNVRIIRIIYYLDTDHNQFEVRRALWTFFINCLMNLRPQLIRYRIIHFMNSKEYIDDGEGTPHMCGRSWGYWTFQCGADPGRIPPLWRHTSGRQIQPGYNIRRIGGVLASSPCGRNKSGFNHVNSRIISNQDTFIVTVNNIHIMYHTWSKIQT